MDRLGLNMESLQLLIAPILFLRNFLCFRKQLRCGIPTDILLYYCKSCKQNIVINPHGVIILQKVLTKPLKFTLEEEINETFSNHISDNNDCVTSGIVIHSSIQYPTNLMIFYPESDSKFVEDFSFGPEVYKIETIIQQDNSDQKSVFVLYGKEKEQKSQYTELIGLNFDGHLNLTNPQVEEDIPLEDIVEDDESFGLLQHSLPRMIGGGRTVSGPCNYICAWCPQNDTNSSQKGKFREKKNYRDHFRKKHYGENGNGISMAEFVEETETKEPKWICKNCETIMSIGNRIRHKAICKDDTQSYSSSESDQDDENNETREEYESTKRNVLKKTDSQDIAIQTVTHIGVQTESIDVGTDDSHILHTEQSLKLRLKNISPGVYRPINDETVISFPRSSHGNRTEISRKNKNKTILDDFDKQEKRTKTIQLVNESEFEDDSLKTNINKWWLRLPKECYINMDKEVPNIFLPTDPEGFVTRVVEQWKVHNEEKRELDKRMTEIEEGDEKMKQYSEIRDKPFLDKYISFVKSQSTKDVLKIFTEDYQENDVPIGSKSSTATQYSNRIFEFFTFLSSVYDNFHFDWMLDFEGKIEKTLNEQTVSTDIFIPTTEDFTTFVKQFRYGSNPAANCGLRIFALKKMIGFLNLEIKNNEHRFEGSIIEKSKVVQCLLQKLNNLDEQVCPDGTIKHISIASNKSHIKELNEKIKLCPEKSIASIMKGVSEYYESEHYINEKTKLTELACKKNKIPTTREYMNSTNWLLEMLISLGGNRPCALLGITVKDWECKKPGYCPFDQEGDNDVIAEDAEFDKRKVLENPYVKPKGEVSEETTGVIVKTDTDKISIGPPCYIWIPNELVVLVNDHSLMAAKIMPTSVDICHPSTRLFLNSNGKPIIKLECKHLKEYIGLPITAYDFRRSLSTFCLENKDEAIRLAESSVLRHKEDTAYAYYFQKHCENVEYVSVQYAKTHCLVKANVDKMDSYFKSLRKSAANEEWDLMQKRSDKAIEYGQEIMRKRKLALNKAKTKGGRNWMMPAEYDAFLEGIQEAIRMAEEGYKLNKKKDPFAQLLKYIPGNKQGGVFPPNNIWWIDMCRILYGLTGPIGEAMRQAELSVYDGVPFTKGMTGRKKIALEPNKNSAQAKHMIIASYWREKIKEETKQIVNGKWLQLKFVFNERDFQYYIDKLQQIKQE